MPRAKRICPRPGCPKPADGRYCTTHNREHEAARGTSTQRGYGAAHQAERRRWIPLVMAGKVACAKCGQPITPDTKWDLGHTDDRATYTGPEHARCNRADGGRRSHRTPSAPL